MGKRYRSSRRRLMGEIDTDRAGRRLMGEIDKRASREEADGSRQGRSVIEVE